MATAKRVNGKRLNGHAVLAEEFDADMLVDLHRSGLTEEHARRMRLHYCAESPEGITPTGAGYVIPYFDRAGRPTAFYRYRYLVDTRSGFERLSGAKQRRYTQPADSHPQVYWPPFLDWETYAEGTEPLLLTEGEKKAARSTIAGIPCLGLGGVWSFQNALRGEALLPDLDGVEWEDRPTYILYDSDAADKVQIQAAEFRLARRLLRAGAQVHIVRLPGRGDSKQGLDDFIENEGAEALSDLLSAARPFNDSMALHELNTEVAYVRDPGIIYVLGTGQQVTADAFRSHRFSDRTYTKVIVGDKGSKLEERSTATDWLKWPHRNAVEKLEFEPGQPVITDTGALNLWRGWPYEPRKGDISFWNQLLDHIFKGQPDARKWAEQWCAFPFQNPGVKNRNALVIWGRRTGTGKSLIGYTVGDLYGEAFKEIGDEQIEKNDFNSWANKTQFVLGDDITGNNNRVIANALKRMITREKIEINIKHLPEYFTRDCINYYFTSNSPDAFLLDENDRRFFIHEMAGEPLPDEFYVAFDKWRRSDRGRQALMWHMVNGVDCEGFLHTAHAPMTQAKREMISMTRTDLESWLSTIREEPEMLTRRLGGSDLVTLQELMALYDPQGVHRVTGTTFARKLKELGIPRCDPIDRPAASQIRVAPNGDLVRLYALRNAAHWTAATNNALRAHYESTRKLKMLGAPKKAKF